MIVYAYAFLHVNRVSISVMQELIEWTNAPCTL